MGKPGPSLNRYFRETKKIWKQVKNKFENVFEEAAEEMLPEDKILLDLDLDWDDFNKLLIEYQEFSEAYKRYKRKMKLNMIKVGQNMATGKANGNGKVWSILMVNLLSDWNSDRIQTQNVTKLETAPNELSDDDLNRELEKRGISVKNFEKIS